VVLTFTLALLSGFLVAFVAVAGIRLRAGLRRRRTAWVPVVDDQAITQILERGVLHGEDGPPLDHGAIDEEERRFWSERWEEPEEW
jgi:hypothetical protein